MYTDRQSAHTSHKKTFFAPNVCHHRRKFSVDYLYRYMPPPTADEPTQIRFHNQLLRPKVIGKAGQTFSQGRIRVWPDIGYLERRYTRD